MDALTLGPVGLDLVVLDLLFLEAGPEACVLIFLSEAYNDVAALAIPLRIGYINFSKWSQGKAVAPSFVVSALKSENTLFRELDVLLVELHDLNCDVHKFLTLGPLQVWVNFCGCWFDHWLKIKLQI